MKRVFFWDMTHCSLLCCNRRFGGTYRLHLQGEEIIEQEPASKQVASTLQEYNILLLIRGGWEMNFPG
jgi:hypothetical protein